ncbi:MAG TPA: glycosyltransferase 87 family protein [Candidatus Limnocylindrales bacterium]|jgi:hypothetical protein|nr:glycosyltransferase 87 family protein [Candidatus Limnocylindrales bacterium]
MNGPRRLLLGGLVAVLAIVMVEALAGILVGPRFAVDLEIPLRAADRWLAGQPPYLADAFAAPAGASLPFLYPPYTLPFLAALDQIPRSAVEGAGLVALAVCAVVACRRLAIPWPWVPFVVAWPPFSEGIVTGNVQIALFTAFAYLFFAPGGSPWRPRPRDISDPSTSGAMVAALATVIGAIKVSQPHPWAAAMRHRPRAAIAGLVAGAVVVLATLPLTGTQLWFDWLNQLRLAGDPAWDIGGVALSRYLPAGVGVAVAIACVVAAFFVPRRSAGAWVGVLSVIGAVSLHTFGLLFLIPAMLVIRREVALLVAILIASYTLEGTWAGIALCSLAFAASSRWPELRETRSALDGALPSRGPVLSRLG